MLLAHLRTQWHWYVLGLLVGIGAVFTWFETLWVTTVVALVGLAFLAWLGSDFIWARWAFALVAFIILGLLIVPKWGQQLSQLGAREAAPVPILEPIPTATPLVVPTLVAVAAVATPTPEPTAVAGMGAPPTTEGVCGPATQLGPWPPGVSPGSVDLKLYSDQIAFLTIWWNANNPYGPNQEVAFLLPAGASVKATSGAYGTGWVYNAVCGQDFVMAELAGHKSRSPNVRAVESLDQVARKLGSRFTFVLP